MDKGIPAFMPKNDPYVLRYFDIETGPLPLAEITNAIPGFDPTEVALGNTIDPKKVTDKIKRAKENHDKRHIDRAALKAQTGQVLAVGVEWQDISKSPDWLYAAVYRTATYSEADLLRNFWMMYDGHTPLAGFNIKGFDLPFLVHRSWIHDVPVPRGIIKRNRFWCDSFHDVMEAWGLGTREFISLDNLSQVLGLGQKTGSGKDFAKLFETDQPKALEYLHNDVTLVRKCGQRLNCPERIDDGRSK